MSDQRHSAGDDFAAIPPCEIQRLVLLVSFSAEDSERGAPLQEGIAYKCLKEIAAAQRPAPPLCWLIFTDESRRTAARLQEEFEKAIRFEAPLQASGPDLELALFDYVSRVLRCDANKNRRVVCECTGGTKIMSIAMGQACTHFWLTSDSSTEALLSHSGKWEGAPNRFETTLFRPFHLSSVIVEAQQRHIEQQQRIGRLRSLARLAPILAHEINNPLNSIGLSCALLEQSVDDPRQAKLLGHAMKALNDIRSVVSMVRRTVREESELPAPPSTPLAQILHRLKRWAERQHPRFTLRFHGNPDGIRLPIAEEKAYVVFTNLIDNSARATGGEGTMDVETRIDGDHLRVRVRDDGPGIPRDRRRDLFTSWRQGKKTQGTGMGLGLVRSLLVEEGGSIRFDEGYQDGAGLDLELPVEL